MFKVIEDLAVADKLWEAGLLWRRWLQGESEVVEWGLDITAPADGIKWYPSRYGRTEPDPYRAHIQYAILIEE